MQNLLNNLHLVAREPLTYVAFLVLVGAWLLRSYFLHTKNYVATLKGVPARDRLSALQLLVLGYPQKVTPNHLRVLQQRYLLFAYMATLLSAIILVALFIYYWSRSDIYRVTVSVYDSQNIQVSDAEVTSSLSANGTHNGSVWQFDIPVSARPASGVVTFTAKKGFFSGSSQLSLGQDFNLSVPITIKHDTTARATARVVDKNGKVVDDAVVWVERHENEKTQVRDGYFDLPSYHATGESVMMFIARPNKETEEHWLVAGDTKAQIKLQN